MNHVFACCTENRSNNGGRSVLDWLVFWLMDIAAWLDRNHRQRDWDGTVYRQLGNTPYLQMERRYGVPYVYIDCNRQMLVVISDGWGTGRYV